MSAVRRVLQDPYFVTIFAILLAALFYVLSGPRDPVESVLLATVMAVSVLIILRTLDSMENTLKDQLSSIRGILTEIRDILRPERSYVWVKPKCMSIQVVDEKPPRTILVKCGKTLMRWHGCPEPCPGYAERKPTGTGTLGGMIVGGLLGLIGGPVGVILGGLAGAGLGAAAEASSLRTELEVRVSNCRARGLEPEIVIGRG